jgi:hypothetical protein
MSAVVTLTGSYGTADTNPGSGYVDIVPMVTQANDKVVIVQDPVTATLDGEGKISVELIPSDDDGWVSGPIPYIFREFIDGRVSQWMAYVNAAGPYDISELVPLDESPDFYVPVPGPPNVLQVQSTTTILPGLPADVQISGTSPSQELNFWIPQGAKGEPGADGVGPWIGPNEPPSADYVEWFDTDEASPRGVRVDGDTMLGPLVLAEGSTAPTPAAGDNDTSIATTAFVGGEIRVTHPNTDDVLVQRWDAGKSRWQTVHYDSGERDISALFAAFTAGTVQDAVILRRINRTIRIQGKLTSTGAFSGAQAATLPSGFTSTKPSRTNIQCRSDGVLSNGINQYTTIGGYFAFNRLPAIATGNADAAGTELWIDGVWFTNDAIPTSLPGTLVSPAPA